MADIELVIKIPDHLYKLLKDFPSDSNETTIENVLMKAVENGTPIPDNATNGDVIKAMFGVKEIDMSNTYCVHFPEEEDYSHYFFKGWWNSPYQKGGE